MSAISLKSITGITSITTPAGVDNQLTLHTNDTTERVKIDVAGNVHINNQLAVAGISTFTGNINANGNLFIPEYISHSGDIDSRFGFSGTDTFAIDTAGSERLEINSVGTGRFKGGAFLLTNGRLNVNYNIAHSSTYYLNNDAHILVENGDSSGTKKSVLKLANDAAIVYGGPGGTLIFSDRENERLRITSSGNVNIGGNYTQTDYTAQMMTGANKFISFTSANHNDFSDEASAIIFSRVSDGAKALSGIFQHTTTSFGVATRGNLTLHAGGSGGYHQSPERLRITSGGDTELRNTVSSITNSYSQYLKFRTTQTNGQSAVTGQIAGQGKSGWGGDLVFYSKPANGTPNDTLTERLRIRSDGNIGINQDTPTCQLQVDAGSSGSGTSTALELNHKGNDLNDAIKLNFARAGGDIGSIVLEKVNNNNTTDFIFNTRASNTVSESMRITGAGNLGINHDTSGASTNAPLTIKNSTNSSATRFNLVNSGSSQVESTQIYSQNNDLAFVANANEAMRIKDVGTVEFKGGDQGTDALAVRSENGGASVMIANFRGVTDTGDTGRLGVGKNNNALIFMNASGSQVDTFAIGNTDSVPLVLSTANTERLRILGSGNIEMAQNIRLLSKPNSSWGAGIVFGGNGYGGSSTNASCVVTNGNYHMDARSGSYGIYLNWYAGSNGTYFGNGGTSQVGRIDGSGNLTLSGTYPGSDLRLKENIQNISGATDTIKSLVGKTFTWKAEAGLDDWKHYGFIAQEVQKVTPDLVKDIGCHYFDKDDKLVTNIDPTESDEDRKNKGITQSLTVNTEGVTPILVEAMKELIAKVETLEAEVASLKSS